jgi:hypothetical protein
MQGDPFMSMDSYVATIGIDFVSQRATLLITLTLKIITHASLSISED